MKAKFLFILLIIALLSACAPAKIETPTATAMPTATVPPSPTAEPTATPHPLLESLIKLQQQNYQMNWDDKKAEWQVISPENIVIGYAIPSTAWGESNKVYWSINVDPDVQNPIKVGDLVQQYDTPNNIVGFIAEASSDVYYLDLKANDPHWVKLVDGEMMQGGSKVFWDREFNQFEPMTNYDHWNQLPKIDVNDPEIHALMYEDKLEDYRVQTGDGVKKYWQWGFLTSYSTTDGVKYACKQAGIDNVEIDEWGREAIFNAKLEIIKVGDYKVLIAVGLIKLNTDLVDIATPLAIEKEGNFSVIATPICGSYSCDNFDKLTVIRSFSEFQKYWDKFAIGGFVRTNVSMAVIYEKGNGKASKEGYLAWNSRLVNFYKDQGVISDGKAYGFDYVLVKEFIEEMVNAGYWDKPAVDTIPERMSQSPVGNLMEIENMDFVLESIQK